MVNDNWSEVERCTEPWEVAEAGKLNGGRKSEDGMRDVSVEWQMELIVGSGAGDESGESRSKYMRSVAPDDGEERNATLQREIAMYQDLIGVERTHHGPQRKERPHLHLNSPLVVEL